MTRVVRWWARCACFALCFAACYAIGDLVELYFFGGTHLPTLGAAAFKFTIGLAVFALVKAYQDFLTY